MSLPFRRRHNDAEASHERARSIIATGFLEPTDPASVIARFLEKRSGLHHVCVVVEDLDAALAELKRRGVRLIDPTPRLGAGGCRVAFVHPKAAGGVLMELKEAPPAAATGRKKG